MYDKYKLTISIETRKMKKISFCLVIALAGMVHSNTIQADDICDTKLFKQLIAAEKKGIKRPYIIPSKALKTIMDNEELLCPMQVEKDFNGDSQLDWLGIIEQDRKFYLASYLSGKANYKLTKIKQYDRVPGNQYMDTASKQTLKKLAGIAPMAYGVKFAAIENQVNGESIAYAWDGNKMIEVVKFKFSHSD